MRTFIALFILFTLVAVCSASEIHTACTAGDLDRVKAILAEEPNALTAPDENGYSPLHKASYSGQLELARWLITQGADVNAVSNAHSTPLHGAAFYGHPEVVRLLLEAGTDPSTANDYGWIPLLAAAGGLKWDVVDILIENGSSITTVNVDSNSIGHYAAIGNNPEMLDRWLEAGGDLDQPNARGQTPLYFAVQGGSVELTLDLMNRGASASPMEDSWTAPIIAAIQGEHPGLLGVLLERGVDPNLEGIPTDYPALRLAIQRDNRELVELLLAYGANPDHLTTNGEPLINCLARRESAVELSNLVVDKARHLDASDSLGITPLHSASISGNLAVAEELLHKGASIAPRDQRSYTPLDYAVQYGNWDVASLLSANLPPEDRVETNQLPPSELTSPLQPGEAQLWYTGHCGWVVKTSHHLLVFDYWEEGIQPGTPGIRNGHLSTSELANQDVIVFVSHEHADHFDPAIFTLADSLDQVTYVYGWEPELNPPNPETNEPGGPYSGPEYTYIPTRETQIVDGLRITTIASVDGGQAFMVDGDGLVIYHAGDHAGWAEGRENVYTDEIDFLAQQYSAVDLAFLNVTGCRFSALCPLEDSNSYFMTHIRPATWVPTHGLYNEQAYDQAVLSMKEKGFDLPAFCPDHRGDRFHYLRDQQTFLN